MYENVDIESKAGHRSPGRLGVSPDTVWVQWLVIVAALVQSVGAVIQVSQGRQRSGSHEGTAKPPVSVDAAMRSGVLTIVLGFMAIYAAPRVVAMGFHNSGENLYEVVLISVVAIGPLAAITTIVLALEHVFKHDETPTELLVHSLTAIAATGVLIMEAALLSS
ncbi:hypothetical protein E0H26_27010 [Micromonospora zingiberis]|uniref:Uncharacterized protein n=1 Tax=Micromonospora zingiberis TaxID=2053011 RepID=A0A4R0G1P7_9ACTN|nr:hypothetical protein [Micromonospora zingiberis]TCB90474.1 hypothetical protein E0H26_27010 [Micromonospora zingiberis]